MDNLRNTGKITDEIRKELELAIKEFKEKFVGVSRQIGGAASPRAETEERAENSNPSNVDTKDDVSKEELESAPA
jgi:hypothetical protein